MKYPAVERLKYSRRSGRETWPAENSATERKVRKQLAKSVGILKVAKSLGIGAGTVQRIARELA
jgi:hypothetical protein